jgi:hypothetical protein
MSRHLLWTLPGPQSALRAWRAAAPGGRLVLVDSVLGAGQSAAGRIRVHARRDGPASCCGTTGPSRRVRRSDHQRAPVRRRVAAGAAGRTRAAGGMADAAAAAAHRGGMGCRPPAALAGNGSWHPAGVHAVGRLSRPSGCRIVNAHSARIPCGLTAVGHSLPGRLSWPEGPAERLWRWAVARHASGATARAHRSEHGEAPCPFRRPDGRCRGGAAGNDCRTGRTRLSLAGHAGGGCIVAGVWLPA